MKYEYTGEHTTFEFTREEEAVLGQASQIINRLRWATSYMNEDYLNADGGIATTTEDLYTVCETLRLLSDVTSIDIKEKKISVKKS